MSGNRRENPRRPRPLVEREALERISAVEGIELSKETREAFVDFDKRRLPAEERRRAIVQKFKRTRTK